MTLNHAKFVNPAQASYNPGLKRYIMINPSNILFFGSLAFADRIRLHLNVTEAAGMRLGALGQLLHWARSCSYTAHVQRYAT